MPERNENADRPRDPIDDAMDGLLQVQHIAARSRAMLSKVLGKFEVSPQLPPSDAVEAARRYLRLRRRRESLFASGGFGEGMFGEPVWDMILDLYVARSQGKRISVSSLCLAAAVPPTTALRHINLMVQGGLATRQGDPDDARKVYIRLCDRAVELMDTLLS
jgi:DNA-binding MarR family transcriptional regulator